MKKALLTILLATAHMNASTAEQPELLNQQESGAILKAEQKQIVSWFNEHAQKITETIQRKHPKDIFKITIENEKCYDFNNLNPKITAITESTLDQDIVESLLSLYYNKNHKQKSIIAQTMRVVIIKLQDPGLPQAIDLVYTQKIANSDKNL